MSSVKDRIKEVESFLATGGSAAVRNIPSDSEIAEISKAEASAVSGRLSINQNNHSSVLNTKIILPHIETTSKWISEAQKCESILENTVEDLSTHDLTRKIKDLEEDSDREVKELKERYRKDLWGQREKECQEADSIYQSMLKANGGKPPRRLPIWYWLVLIVIGAGEWLINYDTFAAKFAVEAMAIGMTLLVAFSFAAASHFHGEFLKQRVYLLGKQVSLPIKRTHITFQIVSAFLLILSFAAVILVRYQVIQDEISIGAGAMTLPGESMSSQQSAFELLLPTIFLNLVVYLLGVVVSYALHDSIPGYQSAKSDLERTRAAFNKEDNKLAKEVEQKQEKFHEDIKAINIQIETVDENRKKCNQLLKKLRKEIGNVKKKSLTRLNAAVNNYRIQFVAAARDLEKEDIFVGPSKWTLENYLQVDIDLTMEKFDELA